MRQFTYDLESSSLCLSCAIKNLDILLEGIQEDLIVEEKAKKFLGTGNMMDHCDAIFFTIRALGYIQKEMDAAIEMAYTKGDDTHECQI